MEQFINSYLLMIDYLADTLGAEFEIALYDTTTAQSKLVATRNGYISESSLNSPLPDFLQNAVRLNEYKYKPYMGFFMPSPHDGQIIKTSAYYIKGAQEELIGVLCISSMISMTGGEGRQAPLQSAQPYHTRPVTQALPVQEYNLWGQSEEPQQPTGSIAELVDKKMDEILGDPEVRSGRISVDEKSQVIEALYNADVFQIKGAVPLVAESLGVSEATIYRYLRTMSKKHNADEVLTYLM